jgi:tRNA-2-methylthio-N6-dimethylallyladenosine synthase
VQEAGFVSVFAFKYSPRPHTPALRLGDNVPEEVKIERLDRMIQVADVQQQQHLERLVGSEVEVLIEGRSKSDPTRLTGRSERHEIVHIDAPPSLDLAGSILKLRVVEANKRSLRAEPLTPWPALPPMAAMPPKQGLRLPVMPR